MNALARFQRRIAYGNVKNDVMVPSYSSLILCFSPEITNFGSGGDASVIDNVEHSEPGQFVHGEYDDIKEMVANLCSLSWSRVYLNYDRWFDKLPLVNSAHNTPLAIFRPARVSPSTGAYVPHVIGHVTEMLKI